MFRVLSLFLIPLFFFVFISCNKNTSKDGSAKGTTIKHSQKCKPAKFEGISHDKNKPTLFTITFFDTLATPTSSGLLAFPSYVATACADIPELPNKKSFYDCYDGKNRDGKKHAILQYNKHSKIGLYIEDNKLHIITRVQLDDNNKASVLHLSKLDTYQYSIYSPIDISLSCLNKNGEDEIIAENVKIHSYNREHIDGNGKPNDKKPILFENNPIKLSYVKGKGVKLSMTLIGKEVPAVGTYNAKTKIHALDEAPIDDFLHNEAR